MRLLSFPSGRIVAERLWRRDLLDGKQSTSLSRILEIAFIVYYKSREKITLDFSFGSIRQLPRFYSNLKKKKFRIQNWGQNRVLMTSSFSRSREKFCTQDERCKVEGIPRGDTKKKKAKKKGKKKRREWDVNPAMEFMRLIALNRKCWTCGFI